MSAKDNLKLVIGRVAELALPSLAREIDTGRAPERAPKLKRAILYARLRRAHAKGDIDAMESALGAYWQGGPGDQFHSNFADVRLSVFREQHAQAIEALADFLAKTDAKFDRLVEIGCGDGKVLAECVKQLPSISQAIGLDINGTAIASAMAEQAPSDPRLNFLQTDARAWLAQNPLPGTVMLSYGGVLEYFSPENVDRLLEALALTRPAAIVLVEPADPAHDMETQSESSVFGREYSFSHNHRSRMGKAGFRVVFERETHAFGHRLIMMVGVLD